MQPDAIKEFSGGSGRFSGDSCTKIGNSLLVKNLTALERFGGGQIRVRYAEPGQRICFFQTPLAVVTYV